MTIRKTPFLVAELSANHNGSLERALELMKMAYESGADAVKLQTYTADTITIDTDQADFCINEGLWSGYKLYDLYKDAHTPWNWHKQLFEYGKELGLTVFSSPFDETAVDFLESLSCPIYKIASFEITHHPLLKYIAKTKKPLVLSTGMASLIEIQEAVEILRSSGCSDLTLLHCVSAYPAPVENTNLRTMLDLKKQFPDLQVGLSDHSMGIEISLAAVALGATVIEKHFTIRRSDGGVDSTFSMEPKEFKALCEQSRSIVRALGKVDYTRSDAEQKHKRFRRSIYAVKPIKKGESFSKENVKIVRPSTGLPPKYFEQLTTGITARKDYHIGMPIELEEI